MTTRLSMLDLATAWQAVDEAVREGRGALGRTALSRGVSRALVMEAVDRVELALGGHAFFAVRIRRSGDLTSAGLTFHRLTPAVLDAWQDMQAAVKEAS